MVSGSLWILQLLPPLKQVAMIIIAKILLKVALKHQKSKSINLILSHNKMLP
jgi:hypothetical protein